MPLLLDKGLLKCGFFKAVAREKDTLKVLLVLLANVQVADERGEMFRGDWQHIVRRNV